MSTITVHIDRLRNLRADEPRRPDQDQLRAIALDIYNGVPLEATLERPELHGFTAADVCTVAEEFGKFRARSNKGGPKAETLLLEESGFLFPPSRDEILARARGRDDRGRFVKRWSGLAPGELLGDTPAVIIPTGYEPDVLGRNIRASIAALVITKPAEAEIERFWVRRYAAVEAELTAEHVHLVWWLASNGLGHKLSELDGKNQHLNGLLVRAHDLLETARRDAIAALEKLSQPDAYTLPADQLGHLSTVASWTHPGLFARVTKVVAALAGNDAPRLRDILRSRLGTLASWYRSNRTGLADVAHLNEAHVHMLVERSGLAYDAVEERKVRNEIRARLTELGLAADLDQELPAGVAAWRMGRLEEFYASREARVAGDPDWQSLFATDKVDEDVTVPA